jgi:ABC-type Fe3+/spermidine/putrescine transport system ATPase subunit
VIEARGLSKRFGNVVAVDDLSFDVRPGTVTGFLGPNGSGKSTTMRMFMGLDWPAAFAQLSPRQSRGGQKLRFGGIVSPAIGVPRRPRQLRGNG